MNKTISKVSDTEIKITKTIPEQIIPEQVIEEIVSIDDLIKRKDELTSKVEQNTQFRLTPLAELNKIDTEIQTWNDEIDEIDTQIAEAKKQGVQDIIV